MRKYILTVNPGSTSTKLAVYEGERQVFSVNETHSADQLGIYPSITDQYEFRSNIVLATLNSRQIRVDELCAVVGRGGLLMPIPSGTYLINEKMLVELRGLKKQHASNLGAMIAAAIAKTSGCPGYIVDPVVVDELAEIARISGNPGLPRASVFHALNHKRIARNAAAKLGKPYEELTMIVAHMGGGISVGVHHLGRVIDVNNALDGDGPFSPERSGGVPIGAMVECCFSGAYTQEQIKQQIVGKGGLVAYLGTNNAREVRAKVDAKDARATLVYDAMAYQVAKEIGALAAVVSGKVDAIVLTGGLAHDDWLVDRIGQRVGFIAKVLLFPGEDELGALRDGALRVIQGQEQVKEY